MSENMFVSAYTENKDFEIFFIIIIIIIILMVEMVSVSDG